MFCVTQICAGDPNDRCGGGDRLAVYEMYPRPWKNGPCEFPVNICSVPTLKYIDMRDVLILFRICFELRLFRLVTSDCNFRNLAPGPLEQFPHYIHGVIEVKIKLFL